MNDDLVAYFAAMEARRAARAAMRGRRMGKSSQGGGAVGGYSIVQADSLDEAVAFAKASPHLGAGGTVEVGEALEM